MSGYPRSARPGNPHPEGNPIPMKKSEVLITHDADEFGLHLRQGGWRLGLLVARSVEKGKNNGKRGPADGKALTAVTAFGDFEKWSATEFAQRAGTSAPRVLRFLKAWDDAATDGWVPESALLVPGEELDGLDVEALPAWDTYYPPTHEGHVNVDKLNQYTAAAEREGTTTAQTVNVATHRKAAKAAYKSDPEFRRTIVQAHQEYIAEAGAAARAKAAKDRANGRPIVDPVPPITTVLDDAVNGFDGVLEEADRRDRIRRLLQVSQVLHTEAAELVEKFHYTGVPDEVEWLRQANHALTEALWKINEFTVEATSPEPSDR